MTATFMLQFFMGASIALGKNVLQDAFGVVALYERKQKHTKEAKNLYGDYDIVELWEGETPK